MSDRGSAAIYSEVFKLLADELKDTPVRERIVKKLWHSSFDYDFAPSDMNIDDTLQVLRLAKMGVDKNYPDDGEVVLYANRKCTRFEQ